MSELQTGLVQFKTFDELYVAVNPAQVVAIYASTHDVAPYETTICMSSGKEFTVEGDIQTVENKLTK